MIMAFGYAKRIRGTKSPVEFECGDEGSMSTGGDLCDLHRTGPRYTQFYDLGHGDTGQMNIEIWMRRTGNKSSAHFTNLVRIIILVSIPGFPAFVEFSFLPSPLSSGFYLVLYIRARSTMTICGLPCAWLSILNFNSKVLPRAAQYDNATY